MGVLTRIVHGCLAVALRRWPAETQHDLAREWVAELAVLKDRPWRQLTFALSLAATPLTTDEHGAPRSRWEWLRGPGATVRSLVALAGAAWFGVGLGMGTHMLVNSVVLIGRAGDEASFERRRLAVLAFVTLVTSCYAVLVGRWIGRRSAPAKGLGLGPAAVSTGALGTVLLLVFAGSGLGIGEPDRGEIVPVLAVWTAATFLLAATAARRAFRGTRRPWLWGVAGAPLAAGFAAASSPLLRGGLVATPEVYAVLVPVSIMLPWTLCAVMFAGAARLQPAGAVVVAGGAAPDADARPVERPAPASWLPLAVVAGTAAVLWAVCVVVLQPPSEPSGGFLGSNNTYWVRDLRWYSLAAVALAVMVCGGATPRAVRLALSGVTAWLGVDILLDRLEPEIGAAVPAVLAAGVAVAGCHLAAARPGRPARRNRLLMIAATAAVAAGLAMLTESPTDTEAALTWSAAAASSVLALVAVGAALAASPSPGGRRRVAAGVCAVVAGAVPWVVRYGYPEPSSGRLLAGFAFTALLVTCVAVLGGHRPRSVAQWLLYPAVAAGTVALLPVVIMPVALMLYLVNVGGVLTDLAGNPPINGADTDLVMAMPVLSAGAAVGWLLSRLQRRGATKADRA